MTNLFGDMDPLGQVIRIKKLPFTVIGVLSVKGQSIVGQDQDDTILIPLSTAQRKIFRTGGIPDMVRSITVKTRNTADLVPAGEWVRYATPEPGGAEYVAVCLPAFSPETVHRDP